ncbi:hypothetical protein ACLM45_12865 [Synechococcus sp. A10-1-5-9]|uniref:hypothetical protein n=1 Tax=Synechococcus sp. A10-1-5-9 TaxID=3392295 RepID=UPI0039EAB0FF
MLDFLSLFGGSSRCDAVVLIDREGGIGGAAGIGGCLADASHCKEEGRPSGWKDGLRRSFMHRSTLELIRV